LPQNDPEPRRDDRCRRRDIRAEKPTTVLDEERRERARHGVGAGLERLLVDAWWAPAESALPFPVSKYITLSPTGAA